MVGGTNLQISATKSNYIFAGLRSITFKFGNFTNFKALLTDFLLTGPCQKLKKLWRDLFNLVGQFRVNRAKMLNGSVFERRVESNFSAGRKLVLCHLNTA